MKLKILAHLIISFLINFGLNIKSLWYNKPKEIQLSFMKYTAQMIIKDLRNNHPQVLAHFRVDSKDRKYQIWERNPLCVELRRKEILEQKLNYIHQNPVKANLCIIPEDYVFSSAAYYHCIEKKNGILLHIIISNNMLLVKNTNNG